MHHLPFCAVRSAPSVGTIIHHDRLHRRQETLARRRRRAYNAVVSGSQRSRVQIDESLLAQVAALPVGGQRWLRTALHAIRIIEPVAEAGEKGARPAVSPEAERPQPGPSLDEVLSGEADLKEQAKAYPEIAEELQGIADIADLLREAGRERRRLGEDILRESEEEDEPGEEDEGA